MLRLKNNKLEDPGEPITRSDAHNGIATDDIDLVALLQRTVLFFRKNKWVFLVAILTGLAAGYLRYLSLPTVYKSRLFLQSFVLTNQNAIQFVSNWNELLKSGEHQHLASIFNTPASTLEQLEEMKADEIQKIITTTNPNGFIIDVFVTDESLLPAIQQGIVSGFNNSEYVKERLNAKRARLRELINKTEGGMNSLDSTKNTIENILAGRGDSQGSVMVDVSGISRLQVELNEKLLNLKEELKFANAVHVLQGFSQFKKPAGPNILVWLFIGLVAGISVGYVIALSRSLNQSLKYRAQDQQKQVSHSRILI